MDTKYLYQKLLQIMGSLEEMVMQVATEQFLVDEPDD